MGLENPLHILLILVVVLMLFGAKRLPEMGRGLGDGLRGFKEAMSGQTPADSAAVHSALSAAPQVDPIATAATPAPAAATPVAVGAVADQD